jgi:hypothetical protein
MRSKSLFPLPSARPLANGMMARGLHQFFGHALLERYAVVVKLLLRQAAAAPIAVDRRRNKHGINSSNSARHFAVGAILPRPERRDLTRIRINACSVWLNDCAPAADSQ